MPSVIDMRGIKKRYCVDDEFFYALDNINLSVQKGEMLAILGKSGSGKSTLMNILGCLDIPCEGEYMLDGYNVLEMTSTELAHIRSDILGFIFQSFNLIPSLTALENVELPLIYKGISSAKRRKTAVEALASVGLEKRMEHKPSQLSGGQQQRVAIARAIASDPSVILADEPTGNLDEQSGRTVMDIILSLNKQGKTVIIITHDKSIAAIARRRITISNGRIV